MNPFEMVIGIVLIVTIGSVIRARYGIRRDRGGEAVQADSSTTAAENRQLREELRVLRERVAVLERVVTDTEGSVRLDREIEALRSPRRD